MGWVECSCGKILKVKNGNNANSTHRKRHPDHYEVRRWSYGVNQRDSSEEDADATINKYLS